MPWVRAMLRGQKVYARADAAGALSGEGGRIEIRYKPNDGRRYQARADNLEVVDATPLPDDTCGPADGVSKPDAGAGAGGASARSGSSTKSAAKAQGVSHPRSHDGGYPQTTGTAGAVIVYADGACSGNPGPAGLGVVIIDGPTRVELSEFLGQGTNNIAELTAVLRSLGEIPADRAMMIYTDSQYTIGVVQKGWKAKANQELVAELRRALSSRPATRLAYVPGHSGVLLNERADALAREAVTGRKSRREVFVSKSVPGGVAGDS